MASIPLKCDGDCGTFTIPKKPDTVNFQIAGNCTLTSFWFLGTNPPPGFTPGPLSPKGIAYTYDGSAIPGTGYAFKYTTTAQVAQGNGTGVIKN